MRDQQTQLRPTDWKTLLRQMRIVHFAMLVAAFLQLYVLYMLASQHPARSVPDPILTYVFVFVGLMDFAIALVLRVVLFKKAASLLQTSPTQTNAQMQWRAATIVSSALAYSTFLFGWILAFLGGDRRAYYCLWAVAAIAFFLFIPQSPVDESSQANLPPTAEN